MFVIHDDLIFISIERLILDTILSLASILAIKITVCSEALPRAPSTSKEMDLAVNYYWRALHPRCLGPGYTSVAMFKFQIMKLLTHFQLMLHLRMNQAIGFY